MTVSDPITLLTDVVDVPGVGPRRATAFRRMGIRCAADLLLHLPMRYEHELAEQTIAAVEGLVPHGAGERPLQVSVRGEVTAVRFARSRKSRTEATLDDGTGTMSLTWFNAPWLRGKLHPGITVLVWGPVGRYRDYLQMTNPRWSTIDVDEAAPPRDERYRPIYPASEQVSSAQVEVAVGQVLDPLLAALEDHLHEDYLRAVAMPSLAEAYRMVHRPADEDEPALGRRRLAFDELLLLELGVMLKRRHRRATLHAPALGRTAAIDEHITGRLPFELTASQRQVIDEIGADLARPVPMNRLLQGDVGAGKTVVALYAMLLAVASGHQAALMAPTELLAEQHFESLQSLLTGGRLRLELLTGSMRAAERRGVVEALAAGEVDVIVGTHALLTEQVQFASLAVAVIDEQHRFGVHQRATLRAKTADEHSAPHVLVMTATPIPRTLSLTIFGDLDVSTITELPPGRTPTITKQVTGAERGTVYEFVAGRLAAGEQAYIVVPVIDESTSGLTDVETHLTWLREGPLRGCGLAALHGRLPHEQREAVMRRFREGAIQALVATTVIEVGVDVPDATIIVIEHADRFGLAQLHQLRGRVGRGGHQGLCVLVADPVTPEAGARLAALTATTDGFAIAEKDLEIRGPGELLGARQAGLAPFRVAELPRDLDLLTMARRDAARWIEENPTLAGERDALLKRRLLKAHGDALGLADVG
ncbi:MAG: ATP-dependent DNA helicase RecG [Planctomycetota bacterium]